MLAGYLKKYGLIVFLLMITGITQAQEEEGMSNPWFFGGNFGLTFGDYTLINVSPQIGYRFSNFVAAGGGVNFQYISIKRRLSNGDPFYKSSRGVTGLNVFGRVYPMQNIMLQLQPEANYVFGKEISYNPRREQNLGGRLVPSLLAGGGLVIPSGRGAFIMSVFYDLIKDANSPYGSRPVINFGYNVGF